jgi:predicted O-methyltransferase YrrM
MAAAERLQEIEIDLREIQDPEENGMLSEHLVLFAALALKERRIKSILEIGTFQGRTTALLSRLFPAAEIHTIDLGHDEILKNGTYTYGINKMEASRETNSKITYTELNSLSLINSSRRYDLIWVDGNHVSPYTISDIINSVRLLNEDGYVICDDIYLKKPFIEKNADLSSISILEALSDAGVITYDLVAKRLGKRFNNRISGRKFLAVVKKLI